MALLVHLMIECPYIFYQQDIICHVKLVNSGQSIIGIASPETDASFPILYVCNTNTGEEMIYRNTPSPHIDSELQKIAAGKEIEEEFSMLSIVPNLPPGKYEISVGWGYEETEIVRSNAVPITVLPSTPARLHLANLIGGESGNKLGIWIDLANDPHTLCCAGFNLNVGGGISGLQKITPSKELINAVPSSPVNKGIMLNKLIAWIDTKGLNYAWIDDLPSKIKPKTMKLLQGNVEILPPLYSISSSDQTDLQDNIVLLYTGASAGKFHVQSIRMSAKKAVAVGQAEFAGPKPLWTANHARSEKNLLLTYLQTEGHKLTLFSAPWPGITSEFAAAQSHGEFQGRFLAADAALANNGVIYGSILMWKHLEDKTTQLVVQPWTLNEKNKFELLPEESVDWEPADLIKKAILRVSDGGRPVALFTDAEDIWHIYDGKGKVLPMPAPFHETKQLIEIGFLNGISDPLLICGTIHNGFQIIQLDGFPIPPRMTK